MRGYGQKPMITQFKATNNFGQCLVLFLDAEYGCAPFVRASADIPRDRLARLRSNLCLRTAPPPYLGWGRPAQHEREFKFRDAHTRGTLTYGHSARSGSV
jgi:hypothetical protein